MNSKLERLCTRFARLLFAACLAPPGLAVAEDAAPAAAAAPLGVEEHDRGRRSRCSSQAHLGRHRDGQVAVQEREPKSSSHRSADFQDYYLVDAAAKKKYFVVKDSSGKWVAGTSRGTTTSKSSPGRRTRCGRSSRHRPRRRRRSRCTSWAFPVRRRAASEVTLARLTRMCGRIEVTGAAPHSSSPRERLLRTKRRRPKPHRAPRVRTPLSSRRS